VLSFVANVETGINSIRNITSEEKISLQQRVSSSIESVRRKENLTSDEKNAVKSLKEDDSIVIVPADKGRTTVVIDRTEY
jgi:valyl-tRNA synthetase